MTKQQFPRLLASAPTMGLLRVSIAKFFCTEAENVGLNFDEAKNEWSVSTRVGQIAGVRVIKKGRRFRFEQMRAA